LEALSIYLKDNLHMNYHSIAEALERDDRTIWTSYNKAKKKSASVEIDSSGMSIPLSIFKNKQLTVLEAIVIYLKEKGINYVEISKLLDRDQRNIWTVHSRAIKKARK